MYKRPFRCVNSKANATYDAVVYAYIFNFERPDLSKISHIYCSKIRLFNEIVFLKLFLQNLQGKLGAKYRNRKLIQEKRHCAYVIFMTVSQDN